MFVLGKGEISEHVVIFSGVNVTLEIKSNEKFRQRFLNFWNSRIFSRILTILNTCEQLPDNVRVLKQKNSTLIFLKQKYSLKPEAVCKFTENIFTLKIRYFFPWMSKRMNLEISVGELFRVGVFFPKEEVLCTLLPPRKEKRVWNKFLIWETLTTVFVVRVKLNISY